MDSTSSNDFSSTDTYSDKSSVVSESEFDTDSETEDEEMASSSDSELQELDDVEHDGSELTPLYDGARISVIDSYILMLQYALKHSLTKKAFEELIKLISVHLPTDTNMPKSIYQLKNFFMQIFPEVVATPYQYCKVCHELLTDMRKICSSGCQSAKIGEFIYVPVGPQLKIKLQGNNSLCVYGTITISCLDKHTWDALQKRFKTPRYVDIISDIYDGAEYKKHNFLLNDPTKPGNVSLLMNTDGVAVFKSSKKSLWPIWLVINELPPNERYTINEVCV